MARNLSGRRVDGSSCLTDVRGDVVGGRWFGQSSFATHALATERNVVKVDDDLPLELLGPLGCGLQTGAGSVLVAMRVTSGTAIAVFGTGAVGLAAVMAARVAGCTTIIGVDLHQNRLDLAAELGATHVVDGADPDLASRIMDISGDGVQYAFDTTGVPAVMTAAVSSVRPTGTCGLVGVQTAPWTIPPNLLAIGRNVMGILEGDTVPQVFIPQLIALWRQGRFPFERMVETFPLRSINEAEQASLEGKTVKPVLLPD
jgi:aryl-alcohol dehydrogenase